MFTLPVCKKGNPEAALLVDSARARDGLLPLPAEEKSMTAPLRREMRMDVTRACGGISPLPRS